MDPQATAPPFGADRWLRSEPPLQQESCPSRSVPAKSRSGITPVHRASNRSPSGFGSSSRAASSTNALRVLETAGAPVYYLPPADVDVAFLSRAARTTWCEWKGEASYYDFDDGSRPVHSIAWTYRNPLPGFESIRDHIAFYASKVGQAWVGDEQATPQAGRYYGGWVTNRIKGPIKGVPGSEGW